MAAGDPVKLKPVVWVGSSKIDLKKFPALAQSHIGFSLQMAQRGLKHHEARPLRGFAGAGVIEIVEDFDRDTYRTVYTVRFEEAVYVLHAFQKKSKSGIATPKRELALIERRLKRAAELHRERIDYRQSNP